MRNYRVGNIEVMPSYGYSDLVDEDYHCPIVIIHREEWGVEKGDEVYGNVIITRHGSREARETPRHYKTRYGKRSFYVIVNNGEITEKTSAKAIEQLNDVLKARNEEFRFKYDPNLDEEEEV